VFLSASTYWSTVWCVSCDLTANGCIHIQSPLVPEKLLFIVQRVLDNLCSVNPDFELKKVNTVRIVQHKLCWRSPNTAELVPDSQRILDIRARPPQAPKRARPDVAPAGPEGPAVLQLDVDVDSDEDALLEEMLSDIIDCAEAEATAEAAQAYSIAVLPCRIAIIALTL
jgi:hypothetical protein